MDDLHHRNAHGELTKSQSLRRRHSKIVMATSMTCNQRKFPSLITTSCTRHLVPMQEQKQIQHLTSKLSSKMIKPSSATKRSSSRVNVLTLNQCTMQTLLNSSLQMIQRRPTLEANSELCNLRLTQRKRLSRRAPQHLLVKLTNHLW